MNVAQPYSVETDDVITLADLAARFGRMPDGRIRREPAVGTATEADAIRQNESGNRLCELVDGILVEKPVGLNESNLAFRLMGFLSAYLNSHNLGTVFGPDGMMRLWPGRIRLPDLSYISWDRLAGALERRDAAFNGAPDLAVEIISPGNTREEMNEKLEDYFRSGVRSAWYIYPNEREVHVFLDVQNPTVLSINDVLSGGEVLPDFSLPLSNLFATPRQP